jgi:hypothetical protein
MMAAQRRAEATQALFQIENFAHAALLRVSKRWMLS